MIHKYLLPLFFIVMMVQATVPEKPIVIIVPSRNNNELFEGTERYKLNLDSIFNQDYENYRVIYIDDFSSDGTAYLVESYVQEKGQAGRVTLIKNSKRWGPSRNRYVATHLCNDNEIVMFLDGDDWFADSSVLQLINKTYDDPHVWFTYSHFRHAPDDGQLSGGMEMPSWVISQNLYRKFGWYFHSLKTFYGWLGKRVKLEDLFYEGNFLPIASDMVETFPVAEMSGGKFKFIDDVMYIASVHPTNEMKIAGWDRFQTIYGHIVSMTPYEPIAQKPEDVASGVDVLWFCQSEPDELRESLEDFQTYVTGIRKLYIIIDDTVSKDDIYSTFATDNIVIKQVCELHDQEFIQSLSDYLLLTSEEHVPCMPIDLTKAMHSMNAAYAYAFYFSKGAQYLEQWHNVPCFNIFFDLNEMQALYTFQCGAAKQAFKSFNTIDCTLYSKVTFHDFLASWHGNCINDFIHDFGAIGPQEDKIALVYDGPSTLSMDIL